MDNKGTIVDSIKGPQINIDIKNIVTRDNLGIEGASLTMQGDLCPIVTTVTPRVFYWVFLVWNYYNYLTSADKWKWDQFNQDWVKRNDYYFVLSSLIAKGYTIGLAGQDKATEDIQNNTDGEYFYNTKYLLASLGGMQYYNGGCLTMGFITNESQDGTAFSFPRITEEKGKPLALAFQRVIETTTYYQEFRKGKQPVPKSVLAELGKKFSLSLNGFDECKQLMREALFTPTNNQRVNNRNLIDSKNLLLFLYRNFKGYDNPSSPDMRKALYDFFSPRGEQKTFPDSLKNVILGWEVVIGRQYLTVGIGLIWKSMLEKLEKEIVLSEKDWIASCIQSETKTLNWDAPLKDAVSKCMFGFADREALVSSASSAKAIENGIQLILSVCERFKERDDVNPYYLSLGSPISISDVIQKVEAYGDRPLSEFVADVMSSWVLHQHLNTAVRKMLEGKDGFYVEIVDGRYFHRGQPMYPGFQGIRLLQLLQVMKDLDMLEA